MLVAMSDVTRVLSAIEVGDPHAGVDACAHSIEQMTRGFLGSPHLRRLIVTATASSSIRSMLFRWAICLGAVILTCVRPLPAGEPDKSGTWFHDLSLLVASDFPCTWPAQNWPLFQISHYKKLGMMSAYNSDILTID